MTTDTRDIQPFPFVSSVWHGVQQLLLPKLEAELGALTEKEQKLVQIVELAQIDTLIRPYRWIGNGRPPHDRKAIAIAYIAKMLWNLSETRQVIDLVKTNRNVRTICGWDSASDVPSESVFSRAFAQFANGNCRVYCIET